MILPTIPNYDRVDHIFPYTESGIGLYLNKVDPI
jgi:hypothetical protein